MLVGNPRVTGGGDLTPISPVLGSALRLGGPGPAAELEVETVLAAMLDLDPESRVGVVLRREALAHLLDECPGEVDALELFSRRLPARDTDLVRAGRRTIGTADAVAAVLDGRADGGLADILRSERDQAVVQGAAVERDLAGDGFPGNAVTAATAGGRQRNHRGRHDAKGVIHG